MSRSVRDLECNQSRKSMKEETKSEAKNTYLKHSITTSTGTIKRFNKHYVPSNIPLPSLTDSRDYEEVDSEITTCATDVQHHDYEEVDLY